VKLSTHIQVGYADEIVRNDDYYITITDGDVSIYLNFVREVEVPVIADKLIEILDAMRWQALRRIAVKADPALEAERIGNAYTKEAVSDGN
jgi:hypothetical protein